MCATKEHAKSKIEALTEAMNRLAAALEQQAPLVAGETAGDSA